MTRILKFCLRDEDGAITVDWVVLTAAVVGLALGAILTATTGITSLTTKIDSGISATTVADN